jgi:hypothetical protein
MSADTLFVSTHRGHGSATILAGTIPPGQQTEIATAMQFAQVRTDEQVDWLNKPREWLDWFMRVESGIAGWQDWKITKVPFVPRSKNEPILDWTVRSLRQTSATNLDSETSNKAISSLRELINAGDPVAAPFGSAEQNRETAGYSFGYAYSAAGACLLRISFICINASKQVKDFVLWEDKKTQLSVRAAVLHAQWNRSNFTMFEQKINEYLTKKTNDILNSKIVFD